MHPVHAHGVGELCVLKLSDIFTIHILDTVLGLDSVGVIYFKLTSISFLFCHDLSNFIKIVSVC